MKASKAGEIIHCTFITTTTKMDGKVVVLISVDNYSDYCFGVAVERDYLFPEVVKHIAGILKDVHKNHPKVKPLFVMAYGKEMLEDLEKQFKDKANFLFNPTLADERAMPAAKSLTEKLFAK